MKTVSLSLSALHNQLRKDPAPQFRLSDLENDGSGRRQMSRREWLNIAGKAAVVTVPALKAVRSTMLGGFEMRQSSGRVAFLVHGEERWVIDVRRFAGSPVLKVTTEQGTIRVALSGARVPGTSFQADFTCRIVPALVGSRIELQIPAVGAMNGAFESWLSGIETLACTSGVERREILQGIEYHLDLHGEAMCRFSPDWCLEFAGEEVGRWSSTEGNLAAARVILRVPPPDEGSVLRHSSRRRCLVELEPDQAGWAVGVPFPGGWTVSSRDGSFNHLQVELAESNDGRTKGALVFAAKETSRLTHAVLPERTLLACTGKPAEFAFSDARYARTIDAGGTHQVFLGKFAPEPVWVSDGHSSVALAGGTKTLPFELEALQGRLSRVACSPEVHEVLLPLADAVSLPSRLDKPVAVNLGYATTSRGGGPLTSVELPDDPQKKPLSSQAKIPAYTVPTLPSLVDDNVLVRVVRPEDFLVLEFRFKNLRLQGSGSGMSLVKRDSAQSAYIIMTLPSQHVAEQAFFEVGKTSESEEEKKANVKYPGGSDSIDPVPVAAKLSGPSRLVFALPPTASSIAYSLKDLLAVCNGAPLSLPATATVLTPEQEHTKTVIEHSSLVSSVGAINASAQAIRSSDAAARKIHTGELRGKTGDLTVVEGGETLRKRMDSLLHALDHDTVADPEILNVYAGELSAMAQNMADALAPEFSSFVATPGFVSPGPMVFAPAQPGELQTAIELPYHLFLAPNPACGWIHEVTPKSSNDRVELWHTRLGYRGLLGRIVDRPHPLRTVRAVWSPDMRTQAGDVPNHYNSALKNEAFRMTMDNRDRHEIVHLSSNFAMGNVDGNGDYVPLPISVNHLMLSGMGGWINVKGDWTPPTILSVETWEHRGSMGRDHFVRVVYAGYLFPFGHHASLVKITERKFQRVGSKDVLAVLKQRMFIVVREHEKSYPAVGQPNAGRGCPFSKVTITTVSTPNLDKPENDDIAGAAQSMFWPHVNGAPFEFAMIGQDTEGQSVEFKGPLIFLDQPAAFTLTKYGPAKPASDDSANAKQLVCASYNNRATKNPIKVQGQKLAFAPSAGPGDTTFPVDSLVFSCDLFAGDLATIRKVKQPPFYPYLWRATVRIPAIEQVAGADATREISLHDAYVNSGFGGGANMGEVFAAMTTGVTVGFDGDTSRSGGLMTPNIVIGGVSRSMGAVGGDLQALSTGGFSAKSFLDGARLFGAIPLSDILHDVGASDFDPARVPQLRTERSGTMMRTTYYWRPTIKGDPVGFFKPSQNTMALQASVVAPLTGGSPTYEVTGVLGPFGLVLVPQILEVIQLDFSSAQFTMLSGQKPDISVNFSGISFINCLAFMNELTRFVPLDGFNDPPELTVTPEGITAGYTLGIPTIAVGMFSLQHVSFCASLELPFTGAPLTTRLSFCERENPFTLSVSIFGGGGFFGLVVTPQDVGIEASLEFGGTLALSLGVASGAVYAMAGIYYSNVGDTVTLAAYFRMGGAVEVLGLICISIEFYMELGYQTGNVLYGEASVKVKVEVLFFSKSVTLHTSKTFSGSPGDPTIQETMTLDDWKSYRAAFA